MRCVALVTLLCALPFISAQLLKSMGPYDTETRSPGIQYFIVPNGVYRLKITAQGAAGGLQDIARNNNNYRGKGIAASGIFFVEPGNVFGVYVGEMGFNSYRYGYWADYQNNDRGGGGGGGGSFVFRGEGPAAELYVAGGGGGGSSHDGYSKPADYAVGRDGSPSRDGTAQGDGRVGGVNGASVAEGGKGWLQVRTSPTGTTKSNTNPGNGGWGGGACGIDNNPTNPAGGGGAGGYSGGASGVWNAGGGGGGGSYVRDDGASKTFTLSAGYSHGLVTFEVASSCGENSDFDLANVTCLCRSGYFGNGCVFGPDGCPPFIASTNTTFPFPVIATNATYPTLKPKIAGDNLYLTLTGPYVQDRKYTKVNFKNANATGPCNFNGKASYWKKGFGGDSPCQDQLVLTLPWKRAMPDCKFVKNTQGDVDVYSANLELTFEESMGTHFGVPLTRTSYHSYDVTVYFPNKLTVQLNNTQVKAEVQLDIVLTKEQYNPVDKTLTLTFTTVTPWSGRLAGQMNVESPSHISLVSAINADNSDASCTLVSGSSCAQTFPMTFKINTENDTSCNFDGNYALNATIFACRKGDCNNKTVDITFNLATGSVCAQVAVRPSIKGTMKAFNSLDFSGEGTSAFKLGDRVYFKAYTDTSADTPDAQNAINMTFSNIRYYSSLGDATLLNNGMATEAGGKVFIQIFNKDKYFSLYFSGEQFPIPFDSSYPFDFAATASITWAGGSKKRNVEMFWQVADLESSEGASMNLGARVNVVGQGVTLKPVEPVTNSPVITTVVQGPLSLANVVGIAVGGVVVGVVLVLGVVFTIYKRMQNQFVQVPTSEPIHA